MTAGAPRRFRAMPDGGLDGAARAAYAGDGFLVLEDFATAADCDRLRARAAEIVDAFDPDAGASIFSSTTHAHAEDAYFLGSGDKIRCFFEADACDAAGRLAQDKALSINKIGHALHDLDPVFAAFSRDPRLARLAGDLGFAEPLLLQSMYIFKQPGIGGEVVCHQDASFLYTEPPSVTGFWFALEDATVENGCMFAIAGGHQGPMRKRFRRQDGGMVMQELDATPWPQANRVPLEARKGTLVVLHGLLPHFSAQNRSPVSRQAYTLHLIDGVCRYAPDNWLHRDRTLPLRGFA